MSTDPHDLVADRPSSQARGSTSDHIARVLVANRGEIARRVVRTCRSLGIETVAICSEVDADAPFVREADVAVRLPGTSAAETYLRADLVLDAARTSGSDAVHPGYGLLSENAEFARAVADAGLTWIGPDPDTIEQMGSKIRAKQIVAAAGVRVLGGDDASPEDDVFPKLVKASAGGGGRGMRVVERAEDLAGEIAAAEAEARAAFGDGTVFVEPYLRTGRHVEVQVLADRYGTCWVLGERDCSIQRRHQKVIEETPAPCLDDALRAELHAAARTVADAVGYVGAGTVEFLVDSGDERGHSVDSGDERGHSVDSGDERGHGVDSGDERGHGVDSGDERGHGVDSGDERRHGVDSGDERRHGVDSGRAYFLEMNTRLQVEHPVTECVTGLDLVALQVAVAEGSRLAGEVPPPRGHAVEARVYAEDPARDWQPQTGVVRAFEVPGAAATFAAPSSYGLRVDSAVEPGTEVGIHYDPMLAKVVAWAPDRTAALRMLRGALRSARVHGVVTNLDLLVRALADDDVIAGRVHTGLLAERFGAWSEPRAGDQAVRRYATAAAVADAVAAPPARTVQRRIPPAFRNVPSEPRTRAYRYADRELRVAYADLRGRIVAADEEITVLAATPAVVRLEHGGVVESYEVSRSGAAVDLQGPSGSLTLQAVPRFTAPSERVRHGSLLAPMPASVVSVAVEVGQRVDRGQAVVVLEAMKMQHTIGAPADGVVAELFIGAGDQVVSGAVLAVVEGESDE